MWLFSSPKDYSEMLKKIATTMFFVSLLVIVVLSHTFVDISLYMESISFGFIYKFGGFELYISYFYLPTLFALAENIFKLHDRISDLFHIRFRFDKNVIIAKFLLELQMQDKLNKVNKKNRNQIMYNIFYLYASSTSPKIDRHFIDMALGVWSWYWIILDTVVCFFISSVIWLTYSFSWKPCLVLIGIIIVCLLAMFVIKKFQCSKYALLEIDAILKIKNSRNDIKRYLKSAL